MEPQINADRINAKIESRLANHDSRILSAAEMPGEPIMKPRIDAEEIGIRGSQVK
jgi:hypothetical protein